MGTDVDVAVVGAGLSGLVAARRVAAGGARVIVLEARARVGGRLLTARVGGGEVDLGAQWISPAHRRVVALAEELGVATFPQYREGAAVLARDAAAIERGLSRVSLFRHLELARRVRELDAMSATVPAGDPGAAPRAAEWRDRSVAEYLAGAVKSTEVRDTLGLMIGLDLAADPAELSMLYYLWSLAVTGGLRRRAEFRDGGDELRLDGGAQTLATRLAEPLADRVRTACPVTAIRAGHDHVTIESGAGALRAGSVIVALPPPLWADLGVASAVPAMTMAPVVKCAVAYARPWWREAGLSGEAYAPGGPLHAVVDACAPGGAAPALVGFATGHAARALGALDAAARQRAVIGALIELFGDDAGAPVDYADAVWAAEPFIGGCEAVVGPGEAFVAFGGDSPGDRIHAAGTETSTHWPRYMEGAIAAGERAAERALST